MKINDIRPKNLPIEQIESYMEDVSKYRKQITNFKKRDCPGCANDNSENFAQHLEFEFTRCLSCFTVYMNPGPTPQMVNDFYNDSANYAYWASVIYPSTRESRRETLHKNRAEFVINSLEKYRKVEGNLRVLEIGAGTGDTLSVLRETSSAAIEAWALEPNRSMQPSLVANDVKIWDGSSRESFDLVLGFEVIEHFLEPNDFFEICLNALKPNGTIILSTPNAQSLEVQLLRNKSTTLDIEHISVLTPTAINLLAKKNGFEVKEITTPGSFDLELLEKELGEIKFLTGENAVSSRDLQDIIANCGFSSHMRAVLALNEE